MSDLILYYSNNCNNCKELLKELSGSELSKEIHFLCIDSRVQENGNTYIVLPNGKKMILPPNIVRVPTLLSIQENGRLVSGMEIKQYLASKIKRAVAVATEQQMEPSAFSFSGSSMSSIVSDNFSFLDMDASDLSAEGNGGMRQLHSYVSINDMGSITAPAEAQGTRQENSSKMPTLENLRQQREMDIKMFNK
jgi:hypothetical protein